MDQKKFYDAMIFVLILALVLSSSPVFSLLAQQTTLKASGTIGHIVRLHTDGRWIKDSSGNIVLLRGVNKVGFEDAPDGAWSADGQGGFGVWSPYAVKANLDAMRSWGANAVRMIQAVDWWINDAPEYKQHIKDIITWAGERNIYVIFTGYQVLNYFAGGWQDPLPYPPYSNPGSETIIPSEQAFVDWWLDVATELGNYPNVLFELWNEPHWDSDPDNAWESWLRVSQNSVNAIRSKTDNIVILQAGYDVWWNNGNYQGLWWLPEMMTITGGNILFSTHTYPDGLGSPAYYTYDHMETVLELCDVKRAGEEWNVPLFIGEIGANLLAGQYELEAYRNELQVFNDWNLSYIGWWWRGSGQYSLLASNSPITPNEAGQILIDQIANGTLGVP